MVAFHSPRPGRCQARTPLACFISSHVDQESGFRFTLATSNRRVPHEIVSYRPQNGTFVGNRHDKAGYKPVRL